MTGQDTGPAGPQDKLARYTRPEYRRLLDAARRYLERNGGELTGTVSIKNPDDAERRAIIGLTGKHRTAGAGQVAMRLADLDGSVREATGHGLAELLAQLGPPLRDRRREREQLAAGREATLRSAEKSSLRSLDWYRAWLAEIARDGTLTKLVNVGEADRVSQAVRVLESLESRTEPVQLAELAAEVTGDTKALGHGTVLATLVLRALALRAGLGKPGSAEERRELWDSWGVIVDDLASRVLVLNLPAQGDGLGEWLCGAALLGTPFYVTLHQLVSLPVRVSVPVVYVCENPAVLRRAASYGAGCAPLLCTEGRPSTAFHVLAAAVRAGGGELRYHGDFDWPGVAIAAAVMARHAARPWRMSGGDYLAGVRAESAYVALSGPAQATSWDPGLAEAMAATGRAVYEESVCDQLIADLTGEK